MCFDRCHINFLGISYDNADVGTDHDTDKVKVADLV